MKKTADGIERRCSPTEREALAIYWCIMELRNCIADTPIIVETDHQLLVNMHRKNLRDDKWYIVSVDYEKESWH